MTLKTAVWAACAASALALAVPASASDVSYDQGRLRPKSAGKARYSLVASAEAPCECHAMRGASGGPEKMGGAQTGAHQHEHAAVPERPTTGIDRR